MTITDHGRLLSHLGETRVEWVGGTVVCRTVDLSATYQVEIWPAEGSWASINLDTGTRVSYTAATGILQRNGTALPHTGFPGRPTHPSILLGFPAALPVWGRDREPFEPVLTTHTGNQVTVLLRRRPTNRVTGSVTLDPEHGIATRLLTPHSNIHFHTYTTSLPAPTDASSVDQHPSG